MKNTFFFIILFISYTVKSQTSTRTKDFNVLFIGNSLTYFHDIPETVQEMVKETHPNIKIEQGTFPGISLSAHLNDIIVTRTANSVTSARRKQEGEVSETEKKILEKKWDVIILQEGTVRLLIPEARQNMVETAISEIKKLVKNPDCEFVLFKTWPSKGAYPKVYCYSGFSRNKSLTNEEYCSPQIENIEQEMKLINKSYDLVAKKHGLTISQNANKVYHILKNYPTVQLYEDDIHPNEHGAFLNACIFYQMLTGNKASDLNYTGEIEQKTATFLKTASE